MLTDSYLLREDGMCVNLNGHTNNMAEYQDKMNEK
jgi:hypothetical protein